MKILVPAVHFRPRYQKKREEIEARESLGYLLVGYCIANRVEPTEYLTDILPRIARAKTDDELDALLPYRWRPSGPAS